VLKKKPLAGPSPSSRKFLVVPILPETAGFFAKLVKCCDLDAIEAKFGIPVIHASTVRDLATERAASWLSKHFTCRWPERHGHGRVLVDPDGL
jgi:hypothetical protein